MTHGDKIKRKVYFNDHAHGFVRESKGEALARMSRTRDGQVDTMNRGEECQLNFRKSFIEYDQHLFQMKNEKKVENMRDSLREKIAYKTVLDNFTRGKTSLDLATLGSHYHHGQHNLHYQHDDDEDSPYGKYGGLVHRDMLPLIESEKKNKHPIVKRRKRAEKLLQQKRFKEDNYDGTMPALPPYQTGLCRSQTTLEKFDSDDDNTGVMTPRSRTISRKVSAQLMLPPLQVTIDIGEGKRKVSKLVKNSSRDSLNLPPIFVTDKDS